MALRGIQLTGVVSMVNRPPGDRHKYSKELCFSDSTKYRCSYYKIILFTVSIWLIKFKMDVANSDQAEPTSTELKPITVENLEVDFLPIIYDIIRRYVCCFIALLQY